MKQTIILKATSGWTIIEKNNGRFSGVWCQAYMCVDRSTLDILCGQYSFPVTFLDTQCSLDALGNPDIFLNFQIWPYGEANPGISGWRASGIFS